MKKDLVAALMVSPLFYGIAEDRLTLLLEDLRPQCNDYGRNAYIAVEGEAYTGLGILLSGEAAVIKESAAGGRTIMTVIGPGDLFGEMIAFSKKRQWPASVLAQSPCTVTFLAPDKILGECCNDGGSYKEFIKNLLTIISTKALMLNQRVEYLALKGMREKISVYLLAQYKTNKKDTFTLPLNRNELAEFLNVSRTALSRELGRMRDEGIIDFYRTSIKIKNLLLLQKGAG